MTSIEFRTALRDLDQGRVPHNIDEILAYAESAVMETRQLASALTECAKRQDRTLQLVRAMYNGLKRSAERKPGEFECVGPSAELIPSDVRPSRRGG